MASHNRPKMIIAQPYSKPTHTSAMIYDFTQNEDLIKNANDYFT